MTQLYKKIGTVLLTGAFILITQTGYAQTVADTLELKEFEVVATRIQQPLQLQPTHVDVIDSTQLSLQVSRNIGEVLGISSTLFIKDNGPGGLATTSQRGLSAEQVQVLWEGIPISNVMLGQKDLSLLPASFFSNVQVSSGNPSSAFGGGSLSGAIYLSSDQTKSNAVTIRQGVGSYGQWQSSLGGHYQSGNWQVGVQSVVNRDENDFEYYNRAYDRIETRDHNRQEQESVLAQVGYQSGVKEFESKVWISDSENNIPGTILKNDSRARQNDQALRWLSTYKTSWQEMNITLKNYLDRVELIYFDPQIDTRSLSTSRRWLTSANMESQVSNHFLLKGELSSGLTGVKTNNYAELKTRQQFSALLNPELSILDHRLKIYAALRLDGYSDFGRVMSPSLGLNYELLYDKLYIRGQLSRDFNPPTFNALYWAQGGNPNLEAERANSAEAGLVYNPDLATFSSFNLTGFYNRVHNGIRWYPGDNGVYSPENVEEVITKGMEASLQNQWTITDDWSFLLRQSANYVQAEITEQRFSGDAAPGHQLRYVPKWNYNASLSITKGIATGMLQYRWTGRRYVTDTESLSSSLDPYHLLNATVQLKQEYYGIQFLARAGVRNLLNTNYEIIRWYAMPQRNYHISLTATYQF